MFVILGAANSPSIHFPRNSKILRFAQHDSLASFNNLIKAWCLRPGLADRGSGAHPAPPLWSDGAIWCGV